MRPVVQRALLSVSDKTGLVPFATRLARAGVALVSTGGTARALREAGLEVTAVEALTGFPEMMDGRVKTLHPRVFGGLLGRRDVAEDREAMQAHGIAPIDLLVVNLYPFRETVSRPDVAYDDAIENIDVGGPAMIRAAAKNHAHVAVVVEPSDYEAVLTSIETTGTVSEPLRRSLAARAFAHTAAYDGAIATWLERATGTVEAGLPQTLRLEAAKIADLRYGENPHQAAALYAPTHQPTTGLAEALLHQVQQGKALSYNNLLDVHACMGLVRDLGADVPCAVIVKHNNPCGAARAPDGALPAYLAARAADPLSAFGGIVGVNREVDAALAAALVETFLEVVVAPGYRPEALAVLASKKNLRLLTLPVTAPVAHGLDVRLVDGGLLVQATDATIVAVADARVVTHRAPTSGELAALDFAWRVCKHVKSNAIVFARGPVTSGIGAGQMSRVDSVELAVKKAGGALSGSVLASDAFFPFRDGVDAAAAAGTTAIVQPGGSVKDAEVIAAADAHGLAMVFTAMRHFRH